MNERYKKIAEKAGFMLWGDEDWNPGDVVDWSMKYDQQLEKFAELIVRECAQVAKKEQAFNARYTDADKHPQVNIDQCILIEFGL